MRAPLQRELLDVSIDAFNSILNYLKIILKI